jgi:hypothetical protein
MSPCVDAGAGVVVELAVDVDVDADAEAEADVDAGPKIEPGAGGVVCDEVRDGEPKEKPTLPALGGGDPSLLPAATPNPNEAGVPDAAAPKAKDDGFAVEPKELPNTLPIGGSDVLLSFSFSLSWSLSSAYLVVAAPNVLPEIEGPEVSPNNFVPGAMEKGDCAGAGAGEAESSLPLSSSAALSEPNKAEVLGGSPKSEPLKLGWLAPNEKEDFNGGVDSASFGVKDAADLEREEEDVPPANPDKDDDEVVPAGLESEDVDVVGGKPKGNDLAAGAAGLDVKLVEGTAELRATDGAAKPAKLDGGIGIVAGGEVVGLLKENDVAGLDGLVGGVGPLCVVV